MTLLGAALLALLLAPLQQADTTITVPAGTRLDVTTRNGEIVIDTWTRRDIRILATYGLRDRIEVTRSGPVVSVRSNFLRGASDTVQYRITVPQDIDLELVGLSADISVTGSRGQVKATTAAANIRIVGETDQVQATALSGSVTVDGARGNVAVNVMSGNASLSNVQGSVQVKVVSGNVTMERLTSRTINATTVSGNIRYSGALVADGRYRFESHSGSIVLALPPQANALVSASTLSGALRNRLPGATESRRSPREQRYLLGEGSAVVDAETFSGRIELVPQ